MKLCKVCKSSLPLNDFYKDAITIDGHSNTCKKCKNAKTAIWRKDNRKKYNADMRAYNKKHYTKLRLQRYKLTVEKYESMLRLQNNVCAICSKPPQGSRPLVVDHHHETGHVRGLLCFGCNRAIAILDNPDLLAKAQAYLKV